LEIEDIVVCCTRGKVLPSLAINTIHFLSLHFTFMAELALVLGDSTFKVATEALQLHSTLLLDHPALDTYQVQTKVSAPVFLQFLGAMAKGSALSLTAANLSEIALLSEEFGATQVKHACDNFVNSPSAGSPLDCRLANTEFELKATIDRLTADVESLKRELSSVKTELSQLQAQFPRPVRNIMLREAKSVDGILSYLKKSGVPQIEITASSSSDKENHIGNVWDIASQTYFQSQNRPGQWVCWDFGEMRICPTHYTLVASCVRSWVIEGSGDGNNWIEIHRTTDNKDYRLGGCQAASFTMGPPCEFRFLRLMQTGKRHLVNDDTLLVFGVEFFGSLLE
jgi:hypothetical protein